MLSTGEFSGRGGCHLRGGTPAEEDTQGRKPSCERTSSSSSIPLTSIQPARQPKALVEGSESESAPIKLTIKRNSPKQKLKAPVLEVAADNIERRSVGQGVKVDGEGDAQPEKKKKRKLFGAQPSFTWDPIMNVNSRFRVVGDETLS